MTADPHPASQTTSEAASPPLILPAAPRRLRGRPSGLKGAAHRASRDGATARP